MEREKVVIEMKLEHIDLLEKLKKQFGIASRSRILEMLLDDLLAPVVNDD